MKHIPLALILALAGMTSAFAIHPPQLPTETLNFDDLDGQETDVPNGYGAIATWNNFQNISISVANDLYSTDISGNAVSSPNVAYNGLGADASIVNDTPFTLTSLYLGSLFTDGNAVTITGKDAVGDVLYTNTFTVDQNTAVLETLNYSLVSEVDFSSGSGNHFSLDNVTLAAVGAPEPSTYALMGLTLLGAAGFGAFRKFARQS